MKGLRLRTIARDGSQKNEKHTNCETKTMKILVVVNNMAQRFIVTSKWDFRHLYASEDERRIQNALRSTGDLVRRSHARSLKIQKTAALTDLIHSLSHVLDNLRIHTLNDLGPGGSNVRRPFVAHNLFQYLQHSTTQESKVIGG